MIEKLKSVVGFQLRDDQCNGKIEEILDIFIEYCKAENIDRSEVRHRLIEELIIDLYKLKNQIK
jgi:hypothetical protein